MKRLPIILAVVAATMIATALPFLPGRYDVLAVPLSGMARTLSMASLPLVPIGLVWLLYELRWTNYGTRRRRVGFAVATLGTGSIAVLAVAVVAVMSSGVPAAVGVLTAWGLVLWRGGPRMLEWARRARGRDIATALALVLVPSVVTGAQSRLHGH
jgi:hypothetical protein